MSSIQQWLENTRDWLEVSGKGAWIAAMVLGFIFLWPVGLALLFYMIGTNRMSKFSRCGRSRGRFNSTGNEAFDNYRDETLKRLEEEQSEFKNFMAKLRAAKDKAEFDQFMNNREARGFDEPEVKPAPSTPERSDFGAMPNPA